MDASDEVDWQVTHCPSCGKPIYGNAANMEARIKSHKFLWHGGTLAWAELTEGRL